MIFHCLLISTMSVMIRFLAGELHPLQITFFHNIVAFVLVLPLALYKKQYRHAPGTLSLHLGRGALGAFSMAAYFYAMTVIPLTQARAIALTGPLVSSVFAVIFLKEKIGIHRSVALVAGFVGGGVVLQPGGEDFSYAALLVVMAVLMWGCTDMILKKLGTLEQPMTQLVYLTGIMSLLTLPAALYVWQTPQGLLAWGLLIGIGVIFLINVMAVFYAFKYADVTAIMPFDFSGMVFVTVLAYLVFGEVIDEYTLIGAVVIILSSLYVIYREARRNKTISRDIVEIEE